MKWMDRHADSSDDGVLDDKTEMALREGLRAQPVPPVSADFDARVLSSVNRRSPIWDVFLSALRPALATAAVSTVVTSLVLSSNVKTVNPALAASPPRAGKVLRPDGHIINEALSGGAYLSMNAWRPAPPMAPKPARRPAVGG